MEGRFPQPRVSRAEEVRIAFWRRIGNLPFAGLLLVALQAAGALSWLPGWAGLLVAATTLVWLPGALVARFLLAGPLRRPMYQLPIGFVLGISIQAVVGGALLLADASLGSGVAAARATAAGVLLAAWMRPGGVQRLSLPGTRTLAWAGALVVLGALAAAAQAPLSVEQDAYDHIGYVRRIIDDDALRPEPALAPANGSDAPLPFDPRKGSLHGLIAVLSRTTGVDPYHVWRLAPAMVFPFVFLAFLGFCSAFVRGRAQLAWCGALFLAFYGGVGYYFSRDVLYGQNESVLWFWLLATVCLLADARRGRWLAGVAILTAGGVFVHAGVALHAGVLAATLVLFAGVVGVSRGDAVRSAVVIVLAMAPPLAWRALSGGEANVIHTHVQGVLFVTDHLLVASPMEILRQHGLVYLGGIVLLPVSMAVAVRSEVIRRPLAFAVIPIVVSFVPFVTTALYERFTYMLFRSLLNIPVYPVIVVTMSALVVVARRGGLVRRSLVAAGMLAWGLAFAAPAIRSVAAEVAAPASRTGFVEQNLDVIHYLQSLPASTVVASDPATSYALSAFVPCRFVTLHGQHANPFDPLATERLRAVRDILSPWAPSPSGAAACDRFGVDVVVVNGRSGTRGHDFLSMWDHTFFPLTTRRLDSYPGRFRRVFEREGAVVFLHEPAGADVSAVGAPPPPIAPAPDSASSCRVESPDRDYEITGIAIVPDRVVPGESVAVTFVIDRRGLDASIFPDVVHVRFDHESIDRAHRYPGEKYVRRWKDRARGIATRVRADRIPFDGLYARDYWSIGAPIYDRFDVKLPPWLARGRYRVEVSIETRSLLPNFYLEDLLYNRDHYSGTACGTLEVHESVVRRP